VSALDLRELRALARAFAGDEAAWRPHVRHDPDRRTYVKLLDADEATVWLICWMPGHDTGLHDHDGSSGAVEVVQGTVREERLGPEGERRSRLVGAGGGFAFTDDVIHGVRHEGDAPAVSLHAYSPPLRAMGAYVEDEDGGLRREVLGEEAELRA
jgi:predicted metal-dependent enzyme (double-stranded beta helix superfamily)